MSTAATLSNILYDRMFWGRRHSIGNANCDSTGWKNSTICIFIIGRVCELKICQWTPICRLYSRLPVRNIINCINVFSRNACSGAAIGAFQIMGHTVLGRFEYGYEYNGLHGRLAITPQTDRIHLTLTHALSMKMGCAVIGPCTTGKTETIKDLAKTLALLCIVTNCTSDMNLDSVATILSGLSQCGAWGCFSNFQRISSTIHSVISMQLHGLKTALMNRRNHFSVN